MGAGDDLMASGIAGRLHAMTNEPVMIHGSDGKPRWSDVWDGLMYVTHDVFARSHIINGPSVRQYYSRLEGNRILWRNWDIAPGDIRLTNEERAWAAEMTAHMDPRFIVVESRFKEKGGGGVNKAWPYWSEFLNAPLGIAQFWMRDLPSFRHACAILERSIGYVGHEGGLHHAAAALGKPAVVIFGGYISPEVTGYPEHTNLYSPDERYPLGCGTVTPCEHCKESMSKITVEHVVTAVREMINAI